MTALMYTHRAVIERDALYQRQLRVLVAVRKLLAAVFASECTLQQRPSVLLVCSSRVFYKAEVQSITEMLSLQQADSIYSIHHSRVYAAVHVVLG